MMTEKTLSIEKQIQIERASRCRDLGKKFGTLFVITIFEVVAIVILQVVAWNGMTGANFPLIYGSAVSLGLVNLVVAVIYGITVFSMGKYFDGFKSAGWLYVIYQGLSVASYMSIFARIFFSFLTSCFGIFYITCFSSAMYESFELVDEKMADTWMRFKKIYLLMQAGQFLSLLSSYVSGFSRVSQIACMVMAAAGVILRIWQFILLGESSAAMDRYVNSPSRS